MSDNRPARYVDDDGTIVYRASSLGMCDRIFSAIEAGYNPVGHPQWFQEVLDEGTQQEDAIRTAYEEATGLVIVDTQLEVELEVMDGIVIRGHIDGRERDHGELWEGKKFRFSTWDKFLRNGVETMPFYPMQVSVYMHALQKMGLSEGGLFFTGGLYDPETQEIIDTHTHAYLDPPINMLAIRKRVAKLEGLIDGGVDTMDVPCPKTPMFPCPFYFLHDVDAPEPRERPGDEVIAPLLTEYAELQEARAPIAEQVAAADKRIKALKSAIEGWWEGSGLQLGEVCRVTVDGTEYELKLQDVPRKGYTVESGGYVKVTLTKPVQSKVPAKLKAAAKKTVVKKAAAKKLAAKKVQ